MIISNQYNNNYEKLPEEIWEIIINFLSLEDIKNLYLVNEFFFEKCKNYKYWENGYGNISLLKYLNRVKVLKDDYPQSKWYLSQYPYLFKNNLTQIHINIIDFLDFEILKYNKDVKSLHLETGMNYHVKSSFKNFTKLERLTLSNSMIDNEVIKYINLNKNIRELNIYNCYNLKNIHLLNLNKLKKFSYTNTIDIPKNNIIEFLKKNKNLEKLNLFNIFLDIEIVSHFGDLTELNISSCSTIFANDELKTLSGKCKNLINLNICNLSILDSDIKILVKNCRKIQILDISQNFISDMALIYVSQYLPMLEDLKTCYTYISRIGVYNVLLRCKKLKYLNILNRHFSIDYLDKVNEIISKRRISNL